MMEVWWKACIYDPFCHGYRRPLEDLLSKV
jgi:hypothetical protein